MIEDMKKQFHDMLSIEAEKMGRELSAEESHKLFIQVFGEMPSEQILHLSKDLAEQESGVLKVMQIAASENDIVELKKASAILTLPNFIERELEGHTLFELACKHGSYDAAEYLIECGAKLRELENGASSALNLVVEAKNDKLVSLILKSFVKDINYEHLNKALAITMEDMDNTMKISFLLMAALKELSSRDINTYIKNLLNHSLIFLKDTEHQKSTWFGSEKEVKVDAGRFIEVIGSFFKNVRVLANITGVQHIAGEKNWQAIGDLYQLVREFCVKLEKEASLTSGSINIKESQFFDNREWNKIIELSEKVYIQLDAFMQNSSSK